MLSDEKELASEYWRRLNLCAQKLTPLSKSGTVQLKIEAWVKVADTKWSAAFNQELKMQGSRLSQSKDSLLCIWGVNSGWLQIAKNVASNSSTPMLPGLKELGLSFVALVLWTLCNPDIGWNFIAKLHESVNKNSNYETWSPNKCFPAKVVIKCSPRVAPADSTNYWFRVCIWFQWRPHTAKWIQ